MYMLPALVPAFFSSFLFSSFRCWLSRGNVERGRELPLPLLVCLFFIASEKPVLCMYTYMCACVHHGTHDRLSTNGWYICNSSSLLSGLGHAALCSRYVFTIFFAVPDGVTLTGLPPKEARDGQLAAAVVRPHGEGHGVLPLPAGEEATFVRCGDLLFWFGHGGELVLLEFSHGWMQHQLAHFCIFLSEQTGGGGGDGDDDDVHFRVWFLKPVFQFFFFFFIIAALSFNRPSRTGADMSVCLVHGAAIVPIEIYISVSLRASMC